MVNDVEVAPATLLACGHTMTELAAELQAGRPESDLLALTRPPYGHHDVAEALQKFSDLALQNYRVATAAVAAIGTRVQISARTYHENDQTIAASIDKLLSSSHILVK